YSTDQDTVWYELKDEGQVSFQGSEQVIQLQMLTDSGDWIDAGEMRLVRTKPFYSKWWFITLLAMLLGFLAYLSYRFFINKSRKSAIMEAKVAQLEQSALRAQMNPHFIFNSLNSIQSYIANNENDRAVRFLAKFARLVRTMLSHSRSNKISLQEEIESLTLYMDLEKMRFKEKFDFEVTIDEDVDTHDIMLPPLLIQPYLENAIIHGLAQKRSKGKINLYYIQQGKYLYATVTDNGIGIEQSKKQKKGNSLHKSVGMTITQKRLEMLDAGNKDRKVNIEEIKDRQGEVLGTKVEVKIRVE
ncbi:MAG: histidine kinase, partial [Flavobacteriales bacterium]|nr:histidine kinase [Flavobacteriales bacterium]